MDHYKIPGFLRIKGWLLSGYYKAEKYYWCTQKCKIIFGTISNYSFFNIAIAILDFSLLSSYSYRSPNFLIAKIASFIVSVFYFVSWLLFPINLHIAIVFAPSFLLKAISKSKEELIIIFIKSDNYRESEVKKRSKELIPKYFVFWVLQ